MSRLNFEVGERSSTTPHNSRLLIPHFFNITLHEVTYRISLRHTVESRSDHAPREKKPSEWRRHVKIFNALKFKLILLDLLKVTCVWVAIPLEFRSDHAPKEKKTISESLATCQNPQHPEIQAYTSRSIQGDLCLGRDSLKSNSSGVHGLTVFLFLTESAEVSSEEIFKKRVAGETREVVTNETMN